MGVAGKACGCCSCLSSCLCCLASPLLCCLCGFLVILVVAGGATVLALYLVLLPKTPGVLLVNEEVAMFNSSSTTGAPIVDGIFSFTFQVYNPNRVKVDFGNSTTQVFYQGFQLGNGTIASFSEAKKTAQNRTIDILFQTAIPSASRTSFLSDYQLGMVQLEVKYALSGRLRIWGIASPKAKVTTTCSLSVIVFTRELTGKICSSSKEYTT